MDMFLETVLDIFFQSSVTDVEMRIRAGNTVPSESRISASFPLSQLVITRSGKPKNFLLVCTSFIQEQLD